ncbi:hypothetical protein DCO58_01630 [Helicobacter saguini]|uniref:Uncharacterized protein n=1 Tax=Helicobacter saguini TaxID=1548018 RepID=A0A099B9H9_9HELI|nr:hypothetical protein [Helicobacter saguini]MWV62917.1 hypothetical protein [Helicobacter saguini]MWV66413.1 hypothetical protein [Helicobacter saguini]MWV68764.1 hypothetical protein [Helicobacter saguini]MWV71682.1 hypothetical protein [Helicobacter saguini]TLD91866.1 hypothetical protein LS64_011120 [Helicobacter saguini]
MSIVKLPDVKYSSPIGYKTMSNDIYLGVYTNIVCMNNRRKIEDDYSFSTPFLEESYKMHAILYIGKIIFEKNKVGNFIPKYIPSNITKYSFTGLNKFWLNEKNPKYIPKSTKAIDIEKYTYEINLDYFEFLYYRTRKNIVLSKEQIISYFIELHKLNSVFIKDYIDSINNDTAITGYYLYDGIFTDLINKNILKDVKTDYYDKNKYYPNNNQILIALDYMKTQSIDSKIPYFSKLFYAYLVWSLREYLIPSVDGEFQDSNNLIFNLGAYQEYKKYANSDYEWFEYCRRSKYLRCNQLSLFYNNEDSIFCESCLLKESKYNIFSPNKMNDEKTKDALLSSFYSPSPLGNYYFELAENKNTFVEFYPRIYPSKANPPQGWSKEMMDKLDLKLE